jgi:hypothetical protein
MRGSVEETLNALLEAEADRLCKRAAHVPSPLRAQAADEASGADPFETAIIEPTGGARVQRRKH